MRTWNGYDQRMIVGKLDQNVWIYSCRRQERKLEKVREHWTALELTVTPNYNTTNNFDVLVS